ncbi:TonB-dependent receptor [Sphingomonas ginkgonis]|nr:TonB-dependent receptor [Sphingomonas ginkgonis]
MKVQLTKAALAGASTIAIAAPSFAQVAPAPTTTTNQGNTPAEGSTDRATSPDQQGPADIVVTAQRRKELVTSVPISITVANQAQLERQQVNTLNDLNRIAPSLEIQQAPGQNTGGGGSIRGIGTQTFNAGAVASVGVVVDQVSQGNANIGDLFDIARVEVLKGPQGTLFGLTTSAGVINITTNAPDFTRVSGRVRTELSHDGWAGSKFGQQIVQGVINLPLASNAAIRVSGLGNFRQGVNRNALTGKLNDVDHYGGRARLLWEPTRDLTVNLIGDYTKSRFTGAGDFFTFVTAGGPGILPLPTPFPIPDTGVANQLASCGVTPRVGNQDYCTTDPLRGRSYNYGSSLQVDYAAGPFTISSITAYRGNKDRGAGAAGNVFRADPLEIRVLNADVHRNLNLFTQEVRLTSPSNQPFEYTIGGFYSHQRQTRDAEPLTVLIQPVPGVLIPVVQNPNPAQSVLDRSTAIFGQGTYHVSRAFRLLAGGRYTDETLRLEGATGLKTHEVSYKFGAQYDVAPRTMAYATVSRGYKGGQIAIPANGAPYVLRPEIPMSYEAGLKSTILGGWIADLSVFYEKIRDFQAQQCTVDANAILSCNQTNISGVKSRGAEINFFGNVNRNLSLNTGFIYAKATYPSGFIGTDGADIGGTQLAYAPRYKFTLSGEYTTQVSDGLKGFLAADTVWKSRIRYEANARTQTTYHPHWMVGGRVGLRSEDDRYQVALFVRNLFNEHEPSLYQSDFPYGGIANIGAIYGPQSFRQVGLSLDAKF